MAMINATPIVSRAPALKLSLISSVESRPTTPATMPKPRDSAPISSDKKKRYDLTGLDKSFDRCDQCSAEPLRSAFCWVEKDGVYHDHGLAVFNSVGLLIKALA